MEDIKVGIIGSGYGARVILPCFNAADGMKVAAFASRDPERAGENIKGYNVGYVYGSLEEMLALKELDLICVATPPFLHYEMSRKVLEAGKNLFCEKPFTVNLNDARELSRLSEKTPSLAVIGHQLRFQPNFMKIKKLVGEGLLGELRHVELTYLSDVRCGRDISWDWWSEAGAGGGQLNALGSHFIDILRWWFGGIKHARGHLDTFTKQRIFPENNELREVTSDEFASFELLFDNGGYGSVITSSAAPGLKKPKMDINIVGSEGTLIAEGFEKLVFISRGNSARDVSEPDSLLGKDIIGLNPWRTSLVRLAGHLAECIREGKPSSSCANFFDGAKTQEVLDAVRFSHNKSGGTVDIKDICVKTAE